MHLLQPGVHGLLGEFRIGITLLNNSRNISQSKCHRDAVIHARMAEQGKEQSVLQLQCSAAAKEAEERRAKNRNIVLTLLRSIYFLAKNRLSLTTTFDPLVQLQIANGDELLQQHVKEGPQSAQCTSKFSAVMLLEAINSWLDRKLIECLKSSTYFSVLADECVDISTTEELSICCRWIVNGKPEKHFLRVLHICAQDAATISDAISSFLESKNLDYRKLIGQGFDGAATFAGECNGVQKRMRTLAAHSFYIHCACHRLQLASMQAANSVPEIKKMFGTMGNIWKLFFYSPKKAESLKAVQSLIKLPELKIVKPSDTRWLSHERCVQAIYRELPALIVTLQQLYETSGDAEAYGIGALLATYTGVASIVFLSEVLDILARINVSTKRKLLDLSRLPVLLKITTDQLEHLKDERSEWLGSVESEISLLKEKHDITLATHGSTRSRWSSITTTAEYQTLVAIPYVDSLLLNIKSRFTDKAVKIVTAMSIFSPSLLPVEAFLPSYGSEQIKILAEFYGKEAEVEYAWTTYTSPPLLDGDELISEWKIFRRALLVEKRAIMERKEESVSPSMQEILDE